MTQPGVPRPLPHLPAIDGLRAVAVMAVVLYHANVAWMPGGFLGVDVFFVISGFLITSLLLTELSSSGTINRKAFWLRRFRRLLPALAALLVVVALVGLVADQRDLVRFRGDLAAACTYVTNWYLALTKRSYFESIGRPSPLLHLWSLAVEEQFYLLWPLAFPMIIRAATGRGFTRARTALALLGGAAVSSALMAVLFSPNHDPSRVYFGTDTHAAPILVGAALAIWWLPVVRGVRAVRGWLWQIVGALSMCGLLAVMALTHDSDGSGLDTHHRDAWLYRGGFLAVAVLVAFLIASVTRPTPGRLGMLLSVPAMRWLGERSYAIYLWHWPVVVFTRPDADIDMHGYVLLAVRLVLTMALAEASFRFVERPIRRNALTAVFARLRSPTRSVQLRASAIMVGGLAVITGLGLSVARADSPPDEIEASLQAGAKALDDHNAPPPLTDPTVVTSIPPTTSIVSTPDPSSTLAPPTTIAVRPPITEVDVPVYAVGDSVMLGAAPTLTKRLGKQSQIDAKVNRQFFQGARLVRDERKQAGPAPIVVVHLGNNGRFLDRELITLVDDLADAQLIVLSHLSSPNSFATGVNALIDTVAATHSNVAVLDWDAIVAANPKILYRDHLHMRPAGADLYAEALVELIDKRCNPDTLPEVPGAATSTSVFVVPGVPGVPALRPGVIDRCGAWLPPVPTTTTTILATTIVPAPITTLAPLTTVMPSTTTTITVTTTTLAALPTPA